MGNEASLWGRKGSPWTGLGSCAWYGVGASAVLPGSFPEAVSTPPFPGVLRGNAGCLQSLSAPGQLGWELGVRYIKN